MFIIVARLIVATIRVNATKNIRAGTSIRLGNVLLYDASPASRVRFISSLIYEIR
ncbi:MAG: hypothetical protein HUJ71_01515 [Pseudobutyrivibrio sp.]|nr:hypothetical protein [Pseudobutyrivibrio sp.]